MLITTLINIASFMMIAALPLYILELGGNKVSAGTLMMLFAGSALVFRPMFGKLLDTQGRKKTLIFGLTSFAFASVLLIFAKAILWVYILRVLQGIGLSGFSTALGTVLSDVVPKKRMAEGIGYFGIAQTIASALGPITGLVLLDRFGFDATILVAVLITSASVVGAYYLNYEKLSPFRELLFSQRHQQQKVGSSIQKIKIPNIWLAFEKTSIRPCSVILFVILPVSAIFSFMPLFAMERNITNIGLFFTVHALATLVSRIFGGKLVDKYGYFKVYMPKILMTFLVFILLALAQTLTLVLVAAALYGIGFGSVQPIFNTLVIKRSPLHRRGAANATYYATMDLGFGLGSLLWGAIAEYMGFAAVFYIGAMMIVFSILLYFRVLHTESKVELVTELVEI